MKVDRVLGAVKREVLAAEAKHLKKNIKHSAAAWKGVILKQCGDLGGALKNADKAHTQKELLQVAAAAVLAVQHLYDDE